MIPPRPSDQDDTSSDPIADLPLFSEAEIADATGPVVKSGAPEVEPEIAAEPEAVDPPVEPVQDELAAQQRPAIELVGQAELPMDEPDPTPEVEVAMIEESALEESTPSDPRPASIAKRLQAAALDAAAMAGVLITLVGGGVLLGAPADLSALPFYLPTWALFSLLYHVIPLLFWGSTPGMAHAGLVTRASKGGPLTIGQALRRWLAGTVTSLMLGLPGLLALSGDSFTDRVSQTTTRSVD